MAHQQYKTIHAFGFETTTNEEKKYLFGELPMADAFIAWGRATDALQFEPAQCFFKELAVTISFTFSVVTFGFVDTFLLGQGERGWKRKVE